MAASALAIVVPVVAFDQVWYDPTVAVTLVMTIAIIFTAAFAADNLILFREAREAEFTPILDTELSISYERGESRIDVSLMNVGRGIAAGLEASLWWTESDLVAWVPHRVRGIHNRLRPGEETRADIVHPPVHLAVQRHYSPSLPGVVLQIRYRDGLKRSVELFEAFDMSKDEDSGQTILVRSPLPIPASLTSLDAKQKLLDEEIARVSEEFDLSAHGLEVKGLVGRGHQGVKVTRAGKDLWMAQTGVEGPVYHIGEWLRDAIPNLIEKTELLSADERGDAPTETVDNEESRHVTGLDA